MTSISKKENEIKHVLSRIKESSQGLDFLSVLLFGSIRYKSPSSIDSDYDLLFIIKDGFEEYIAGDSFLNSLFNQKNSNLTYFEDLDVLDFKNNEVQILQAGGQIDLSRLSSSYSNNDFANIEIYAITESVLEKMCALEPGGEVFQRYNSKPTAKSLQKYTFISTSSTLVDYNQKIVLLENNTCYDLEDVSQELTLNQIIGRFKKYQKLSPGLPRIYINDQNFVGDSIMIGTTGDKILSSGIISDHSGNIYNKILLPSWTRVARDFASNWQRQDNIFASLFQRYRMNRFTPKFIEEVQDMYQKCRAGTIDEKNFSVDVEGYHIYK